MVQVLTNSQLIASALLLISGILACALLFVRHENTSAKRFSAIFSGAACFVAGCILTYLFGVPSIADMDLVGASPLVLIGTAIFILSGITP
jgi:hypothetical protein